MSNSIALAETYLPILDEIYKVGSLTARLDAANERVRFTGGNAVELFKITVPGFGNYSRSTGFPSGDVTSTWEKLTLSQDRGISLSIDAMDDEETLNMAFASTMGEFVRTKEVPEIDAYRFAKYATNAATKVKADVTIGTTDIAAAIATAERAMGDAEVPKEGRILFISETALAALQANIARQLGNEAAVNKTITSYNGMEVVAVPQSRFNTAITLGTNGYTVTAGGFKINFMILHPSAIVQVLKHRVPRVFSPAENQLADAWKFDLRAYHDAFVEANKVDGIYVHMANTANT